VGIAHPTFLLEKIQTWINKIETNKYYYEIDIRIQCSLESKVVTAIISDDFKSSFKNTYIKNIKRDSYKVEYLNDNEIHYKIYFEAEIFLNKTRLEGSAKIAYLTYEIIQQKRAREQCYYFNEFKFVCVTDKKLNNTEISTMTQIVKHQFINKQIGNRMSYLENIFFKEKPVI
jgi:hypothetical protein